MDRADLEIKQIVRFGKNNLSRGEIVKLNLKTATIKALEPHKGSPIGTEWHVPYSMIHSDKPQKQEPLKYSPFSEVDNLILQAIAKLYNKLSPENLYCDGEAKDMKMVRYFRNKYEQQLDKLQQALGRTVTEAEAYKWDSERQNYEKNKS